jgi:predicted HicB family RNase H-like nuclease
MDYKGYTATIVYDDCDRIFHGHLVDTHDDVYFEGRSIEELEDAFRQAVDDYLAYCAETDREPTRPFSGKLHVRMPPQLHHRAHIAAQRRGISLNTLISEALNRDID